MKKLGIIDYDQGNIKSLKNAINRVGFECNLLNSNENLNDYDTLFLQLHLIPKILYRIVSF